MIGRPAVGNSKQNKDQKQTCDYDQNDSRDLFDERRQRDEAQDPPYEPDHDQEHQQVYQQSNHGAAPVRPETAERPDGSGQLVRLLRDALPQSLDDLGPGERRAENRQHHGLARDTEL